MVEMKKKEHFLYLAVIVAALTFLAVEFSSAATITSYTSIAGEGVIDRTVNVQTDEWYKGAKFDSDLRTPYLGKYGASEIDIQEEICVRAGNESEITVEGTYKTEEIYHKNDISSYDVGTRYKVQNTGSEYTKYKLFVNENASSMYIEGVVSSRGGWSITACDPETKLKEFRENVDYDGNFNIIIQFSLERATKSAPVTDWLGCP